MSDTHATAELTQAAEAVLAAVPNVIGIAAQLPGYVSAADSLAGLRTVLDPTSKENA